MRTKREDFFPSELYWLDRVGPVGRLEQLHGGVGANIIIEPLGQYGVAGAPSLLVMFDRLVEPEWEQDIARIPALNCDLTILDARVTLTWPTAAGAATWKGHDAPYMILNLYELLMKLALAGAGRIRLYGYPHPRPTNQKFIPMPWSDVYVVSLLIEKGGEPTLEIYDGATCLQPKDEDIPRVSPVFPLLCVRWP